MASQIAWLSTQGREAASPLMSALGGHVSKDFQLHSQVHEEPVSAYVQISSFCVKGLFFVFFLIKLLLKWNWTIVETGDGPGCVF